MSSSLVLRATGSHLYPGAHGTFEAAPLVVPLAAPAPCLVEFADGSAATGTLTPRGDGLLLAAAPYTTARGTSIAAKRWRLILTELGFRIARRA